MDSKETSNSGLFAKSPSAIRGDDDDEPIGLSSSRASPVSGLTMESYMHNFHQQPLTNKSPPVAMSLRTRETSSMALKHIFDQQINNGASYREQEFTSTQRQQLGGFQDMRHQSMPDLRKRIPDLDLTFRKAQDNNSPYAQAGFGSPIPTPTNQSFLPQAPLPPMSGQLMQHNFLPPAVASTRLNPSSKQPTAQMTIFYSGNVNVYDDVPENKAHAIMLLAGNSWSSSFKCPAPPSAAPIVPAESMMMRERAPSPVTTTPSQHAPVVPSTNNNGGGIAKSSVSPAPATSVAAASLASPPPSPALQAPSPLADGIKSSQAGTAAKRPHAGIELPHARKASLARFLEKRKDRVQVQQDQQGGAALEKGGGELTSCNDKADHAVTPPSSKKQCSRSRSSSPSRCNSKGNNTNNKDTNEIPSINEHRFFH